MTALSLAKSDFGFQSFRPGQAEAIDALQAGRDTLVVMPTGSGKSAIYQIAGLLMPGIVLVVSPLIALQKDQVDAINSSDRREAVVINSSLSAERSRKSLAKIEKGECKFVFLAPEQLHGSPAIELLKQVGVGLLVVDEAHCISAWGHDFRPDYLQLGHVIESLRCPLTVALTATASGRVRGEIIERLALQRAFIYVGGFDRPNIYLGVERFDNRSEKLQRLMARVKLAAKPGIVYVATRRSAEELASRLGSLGMQALCYHGGLKAADRQRMQNEFMHGEAGVIVATNAFGMGINKPNVRFVYHQDAPESLDSYYQEIGRGGRDGKAAEAILFFCPGDIGVQSGGMVDKRDLAELTQVAGTIEAAEQPISPRQIAEQAHVSQRKVAATVQKLEDASVVELLPTGRVKLEDQLNWDDASELIAQRDEMSRQAARVRLEQMLAYIGTAHCRRHELLHYFGEDAVEECGLCDRCQAPIRRQRLREIA